LSSLSSLRCVNAAELLTAVASIFCMSGVP
jgi:hypothetical protein